MRQIRSTEEKLSKKSSGVNIGVSNGEILVKDHITKIWKVSAIRVP